MDLDNLAVRTVAVVAVALLGEQVSGARVLTNDDRKRALEALKWMRSHLQDRAGEALTDLERDPSSEDNRADLRKQLTRLFEKDSALAKTLDDIIPNTVSVERADSVISRVGSALNSASGSVGTFSNRGNRWD